MANDIIDIVVTDNSDNVQINATPNLVSVNVTNTSGNIIGSNYYLANTFGALPAIGDTTILYVVNDTSLMYRWSGSAYTQINSSAVVSWGQIVGSLASQTDLQTSLNAKQDDLNGTGFVKASGTTISYDNSTYYPQPTGDTTQYVDGTGALQTFPVLASADKLILVVRNTSGATITKGTVVYINGASGNKPTIAKALATGDATSAQTLGLLQSNIANNANGNVVLVGSVIDLDTSAFTEGQQLYLSGVTAGTYTATKTLAPTHLVYVGVVTRSHPTQGVIEVKIQNGYELDEIHDVSIVSKANNEGLFYESSTNLWKNKSIATVLGYTPQAQLTNPITGTGTVNTLPKFTGTSALGNSNITDSGTLITLGSNTSISSGSLGIGTSALTAYSLRVLKNITGSSTSHGMMIESVIQSDVTNFAYIYRSSPDTQAAAFTLSQLSHFTASQGTIGVGSTVSTQQGFYAGPSLIGATSNYGFRGSIPSGTGRWNLYMDGTAANYMAGSLGVGTTSVTGYNLRVQKNITGATTSYGIANEGTIQSDVTSQAIYHQVVSATAAASFSLNNLTYYSTSQGTFGAGSTVATQVGFQVNSNLIGATFNVGFRGQIPAGSNRWNIYMDGTASNYLAGDTGIGTTALGTSTALTVGGTETASSAIARGQLINPTLVASANNDVLVGLDINTTFTLGAFTGINTLAARFGGSISPNVDNTYVNGSGGTNWARIRSRIYESTTGDVSLNTTGAFNTTIGANSTETIKIFQSTRNVVIQNGGTFTDIPSARLVVNSTTQGFLPPRMTSTEKNAISSPATGLVIFDTTLGKLCVFSTTWQTISSL
jgi:hypothetical protein